MKVELLAHTQMDNYGVIGNYSPEMHDDWVSTSADLLAEFAGRACYQAFHKPNPKTAANQDYLANILSQGHFSVLEHASATFYVTGVSRALTHELIRHRHLSFSELSQRFVNVENVEWVDPPAFFELEGTARENTDAELEELSEITSVIYSNLVSRYMSLGKTRKQAREAARAVMPNATETRIVVTGNMRAWRDMLAKRYSTHADAEIREFAAEVLRQLREIAPGQFQDFPSEPFDSVPAPSKRETAAIELCREMGRHSSNWSELSEEDKAYYRALVDDTVRHIYGQ